MKRIVIVLCGALLSISLIPLAEAASGGRGGEAACACVAKGNCSATQSAKCKKTTLP